MQNKWDCCGEPDGDCGNCKGGGDDIEHDAGELVGLYGYVTWTCSYAFLVNHSAILYVETAV